MQPHYLKKIATSSIDTAASSKKTTSPPIDIAAYAQHPPTAFTDTAASGLSTGAFAVFTLEDVQSLTGAPTLSPEESLQTKAPVFFVGGCDTSTALSLARKGNDS
jgi:hypothetical protein